MKEWHEEEQENYIGVDRKNEMNNNIIEAVNRNWSQNEWKRRCA